MAAADGVFINYRGDDSQHCAALLDRELSARFGRERVFRDCRSIPLGDDFADAILGRLRRCRVLLALVGPRWATLTDEHGRRRIDDPGDWIRREIAEAFANGVRVVPVLVDGVDLPAEADLPPDIARLSRCQYQRLSHRSDEQDVARLVDGLIEADRALATPPRRRRALWTALAVGAAAAAVLAGVLMTDVNRADDDSPEPASTAHTIGDPFPADRGEFLAVLVNHGTGECLSRNGPHTHPDDSEHVGADVYQWSCGKPDDLGQTLVLDPQADGWLIRSSATHELCVAAHGAPGDNQDFQPCAADDDRQLWRLRRVERPSVDPGAVVVIENVNTGLCLGNPGGNSDGAVAVMQRECAPDPTADAEWTVRDGRPVGDDDCLRGTDLAVRNHETDRPITDGLVDVTPAPLTAQGCPVTVTRPDGTCLAPAPDLATAGWEPCTGRRGQTWIVEPVGTQNGRLWHRIHATDHIGRCLDSSGALHRCDGLWSQQWSLTS